MLPACAALLLLQTATVEAPSSIPQGDTLRVHLTGAPAELPGSRVHFAGRNAPSFPDPSGGGFLALVPIPVDLPPGSYKLDGRDPAGRSVAARDVMVTDARFPIQNITVTRQVQALKPLPGEMEAIHDLQQTVSPQRYWAEPFRTPTPGCMISPFGVIRYHNGKPTGNYHRGIDIRSPEGRPVRAISPGRVRIAKMYRLHGGTVGLDHGQGVTSLYIHLSRLAVRPGQGVQTGDVIGYVGHTGFATGPHLHWGLYVNGLPVNSRQWIRSLTACK